MFPFPFDGDLRIFQIELSFRLRNAKLFFEDIRGDPDNLGLGKVTNPVVRRGPEE